jgi:hypothetical protein
VSLALLATPSTEGPSAPPVSPSVSGRETPARHTSTTTLAGRLNRDWAQLVAGPAAGAALRRWALTCPALTQLSTLDDVLSLVADADADATVRDAVLLALIEAAQAGDALAGRTVLQTMLGKAVRVAGTVARRDDVRGDQEEALARAVAALWQAIATYPVALRPARVAANLALDTVAVAQRGHTGSSHFRRSYRELPLADVGSVSRAVQHDGDPDDVHGPVDAQLLTVLAWAVRAGVLDLDDAQLLVRVYSVDEHGRPADGRAVAAQAGLSWPALRQRCRRLARCIGAAAVDAGIGADEQPTSPWTLAAA